MKKAPLLAGALLALVPVAALLPGCGGGNGGVVTPTGTAGPTPTYTSGPVPTDTTTSTPGPTGTITPTSTSVPGATATPTITPQPTSTTAPTTVPTSTPIPAGAVRTNLTFTPSSGSSFAGAPLQDASLILTTSNATNTLRFSASGAQDGNRVILSGTLPGAGQGNGYSASSSSSNSFRVRNDITANGSSTTGSFRLQSGEISITKFSQSNTAITFRNAVFSVQNDAGSARGTVTVNGTISGPYSTN